jgi:phosphoribosyl 1,2-cyclic phosphodiesterase
LRTQTKIIFLGTAGGRITTFRLVRRSGGFLIERGDLLVQVDPGPGAFVYLKEKGIDYRRIRLLVISHLHIDHTADANTLIEASTDGGKLKNLSLFCPRSVVEGESRVIFPYLLGRLKSLEYIEEGKLLNCDGFTVRGIMKHIHHGAETYGLELGGDIVYVSCARFEERMLEVYPKRPRLMILNTTFYSKRSAIDHLSVEEAKELIRECEPDLAVITHYSMEMHQKDPEKVAKELSGELGVNVISAFDGMELTI